MRAGFAKAVLAEAAAVAAVAAVVAMVGAAPLAAIASESSGQTIRFVGEARDLKTGEFLYTEAHEQRFENGRWVQGLITYRTPAGESIGEKSLDFRNDPFVPEMRMRLPGMSYEEAISRVDGSGAVVYAQRGSERKEGRISRSPEAPLAADSGFHALIQTKMPALAKGDEVALRFGVVGRRDQYRFKISKVGETSLGGKALIILSAAPDSFLRVFADPLKLVYERDSGRLVVYKGPSNIPNPATGKVPSIRMDYPTPEMPLKALLERF